MFLFVSFFFKSLSVFFYLFLSQATELCRQLKDKESRLEELEVGDLFYFVQNVLQVNTKKSSLHEVSSAGLLARFSFLLLIAAACYVGKKPFFFYLRSLLCRKKPFFTFSWNSPKNLFPRGLSCLKSLSLSFSCLRVDQMHELFTVLAKDDSKVCLSFLFVCFFLSLFVCLFVWLVY